MSRTADPGLQFVPSRNLHARLADELGLAIVRGDYLPGEPLPPEVRLCETLGVSRTAAREAIKGLIAKGLIEARPKTGTRVRQSMDWNHLDPDVLRWRLEVTDTDAYLAKMFQLRRATEPAACALAAQNADAEDRRRLEANFHAMIDAGDDNAAWVEADLAFHKTIYLATRNEFFWPIGQLFGFGLKHMFKIAATGTHRPRAVVEHGTLMRAIVDGNPEAATQAALVLLENAVADIDRIRGR
ncbi:FadR/GntR family transcriptional regulator [Chelativorans sp. AA-79]|uniref:FadR/GntR family transcriptional regulator n=1 Tax=Chelativorans sp. AA-79 TaxID=3028735 RepID=UPI0023F64447|nr:FadR/GntR family transcriptional regulator [Chelativorans sp. AA-79]WEX10916.1 FadR/GntR family transcriptional regulator [Chelativorans sp. AA-79]